jgi:hypothetical protein
MILRLSGLGLRRLGLGLSGLRRRLSGVLLALEIEKFVFHDSLVPAGF